MLLSIVRNNWNQKKIIQNKKKLKSIVRNNWNQKKNHSKNVCIKFKQYWNRNNYVEKLLNVKYNKNVNKQINYFKKLINVTNVFDVKSNNQNQKT